jgi:hypothetical protein
VSTESYGVDKALAPRPQHSTLAPRPQDLDTQRPL